MMLNEHDLDDMRPDHPDRMPIMGSPCIPSVPWSVIAGHERQAMANHRQTLNRLAERGGLGACEAVAIIENRRWHRMDQAVAERRLMQLCTR